MSWPLPERITTERLVLRPLAEADWTAFRSFMLDDEATRHLLFSGEQRTAAGALELFNAVRSSYASDEPIFVLALAAGDGANEGAYLGSCGLSPLARPDQGEATPGVTIAECYYTVVRSQWANGYASEALGGLLRHVETELPELNAVYAFAGLENPASWRVARRAGMEDLGKTIHPDSGKASRKFVWRRATE